METVKTKEHLTDCLRSDSNTSNACWLIFCNFFISSFFHRAKRIRSHQILELHGLAPSFHGEMEAQEVK